MTRKDIERVIKYNKHRLEVLTAEMANIKDEIKKTHKDIRRWENELKKAKE